MNEKNDQNITAPVALPDEQLTKVAGGGHGSRGGGVANLVSATPGIVRAIDGGFTDESPAIPYFPPSSEE